MALSQIQCLDNHHVNLRVSESKPEFFYSEDQRLALESLITGGRDAFRDYISKNGVREFLSGPELERIVHIAEAYRPGYEHHPKPETPGPVPITPGSGEEGGDGEVSLQYWPDRSEASVAELDLGWPEASSYRGVTRVTVYTQPPTEGNTHIKEVVRKSIASAQKNLRVRCCGGVEFFTRSAQKLRGSLSQKFLLVDGDRAISGSYSFTWSSSRLDRNLITVITGQAVETFDLQFRDLFLMSRGVSLSKVPMVDEPIPDPLPQAAPAPVSATVARKLINPKYALVVTGTHTSPTSSDQNSSNKNSNSQNPTGLKFRKGRLKNVSEEPPIHPGLAHLEKAYLIPYLPTWPEPDPPSDVIGFINIRDEKRANQVHLQRSERFEVSQAIRFKSPLTLPAQTEAPVSGQDANAAETAEPASGNTSAEGSTPVSPTNKQLKEQKHTAPSKDQTDATDSRGPPQQPSTPLTQDTHKPNAHTPTCESNVTADSQPTDNARQTPEAQIAATPVPKRRTLQLVIEPAPSEQPSEAKVTLIKIDPQDTPDGSSSKKRTQKDVTPGRGRLTSNKDGGDSGSNGDGSQDSTKVMCDRAANDEPSSASTASDEEFYDCSQQQPSDLLTNRITTGSGHGHRQGDGVNMMARLSQSMLDLREPSQSEDSSDLIRQSQQLRRHGHPSPHRHIGQVSTQ
eukprot:superscaffoldBa00001448_g10603